MSSSGEVGAADPDGEAPKQIQMRLSHSSTQVTLDRYGHLLERIDRETAD